MLYAATEVSVVLHFDCDSLIVDGNRHAEGKFASVAMDKELSRTRFGQW